MRFEPIGPVEATEFELAGAAMVAVAVNDRAHIMDAAMFRLLFRKIEAAPPAPVDCDPIAVTRENMRTIRRQAETLPKNAAASMRKSPVRSRVEREVNAVSLSSYPEALRDPRANMQRALWDALADGAKNFSDLCRAANLDPANSNVYGGLTAMRNKLLVHKRDSDGAWERTREE